MVSEDRTSPRSRGPGMRGFRMLGWSERESEDESNHPDKVSFAMPH